MHVFLFSDHVGVDDEVALKRRGADRGLLVMGPGCGTAMLAGVGLGFANVVRSGPVGIVAAAGTGAQEAACLLEAAGAGVSQIIGVGGRDLSAAVGGLMFRQGMRMLGDDPSTDTLLLVSKPPSPEVVATLAEAVPSGMRVAAAFVGWTGGDAPFPVHATIEAAVWSLAGGAPPPDPEPTEAERARAGGRRLLGLYSGGTLAYEALTILTPLLGPVAGNLSPRDLPGDGHRILDLGEEEYTRGTPHPMVDPGVRIGCLQEAADDDGVGCVLIDVVLGHGSHDDPAGALAPSIAALTGDRVVVAHVCGSAGDPQGFDRQVGTLEDAGARVLPSNAAAARFAARIVAGGA
jgi:FdrA protein